MREPLVVYLDSQDFSKMSDHSSDKLNLHKGIEAELNNLVEEGSIEVRYSAVHISEIAHTNMGATANSAARAALIKRLSRGKCLRIWTDIFADELLSHLSPNHKVEAKRENNQWLEIDFSKMRNMLDRLQSSLNDTMKAKGKNRKERRSVRKDDILNVLKNTAAGREAVDRIVDEFNKRFPIQKPLDRETLVLHLGGKIGSNKFETYMRDLMADPDSLISNLAPEFDPELKLPRIVRDMGNFLTDKINPTLEDVSNLMQKMPPDETFDQLRSKIRKYPTEIVAQVRRDIIREELVRLKFSRKSKQVSENEIDLMTLPTVDIIFEALQQILRRTISTAEAGRNIQLLKQSDAADIFHATYIPYVDIFRCDKAWESTFSPIGRRFGTQVVAKIEGLVPEIRRQLQAT